MVMNLAICSKCQHYKVRPKTELFNMNELQVPGVLKAKLEGDQQEQERRLIEMQRFESGQLFTYEPYYYPWCTAYTPFDNTLQRDVSEALEKENRELSPEEEIGIVKIISEKSNKCGIALLKKAKAGDNAALDELAEKGSATINPVSGDIMQVYILCAQMNPSGKCPIFKQR